MPDSRHFNMLDNQFGADHSISPLPYIGLLICPTNVSFSYLSNKCKFLSWAVMHREINKGEKVEIWYLNCCLNPHCSFLCQMDGELIEYIKAFWRRFRGLLFAPNSLNYLIKLLLSFFFKKYVLWSNIMRALV